jgi:hypothetical protein
VLRSSVPNPGPKIDIMLPRPGFVSRPECLAQAPENQPMCLPPVAASRFPILHCSVLAWCLPGWTILHGGLDVQATHALNTK